MKRRRLGSTALHVTDIGLGTMTFGNMTDETESLASVRYQTIQNNYSLLNRRFEDELATVCQREDVSLLAYSPIAGGVLSGKYQGGKWPKGARFTVYKDDSPRTQAMTRRFLSEQALATAERVHAIAKSCDMDPITFSVAWTLNKKFVGSTIIGVTQADQLGVHLAAAEVQIPDEALRACEELSREIRYPLG